MKSRFLRTLVLPVLMTSAAISSTLGTVGTAYAVPLAQARAHGLAATVSGLLNVNVAPTPQSSCTSGLFCVDVDTLATVNVSGLLATDVLVSSAITNTSGSAALAIGQAYVANPALNVLGLLGVTALALDSSAIVAGTCFQGLAPVGVSGLANAATAGLLSLLVNANPNPNTVVLDLLGIKVVANEQIVVGDFFSNLKLTVNPLHISINNLLGLDLLSADITIAQSEAKVTCSASTVP